MYADVPLWIANDVVNGKLLVKMFIHVNLHALLTLLGVVYKYGENDE